MKKVFSCTLWGILTGISGVVFTASVILSYVATNHASAAINMMFGTSNFKTVNDPNAQATDFYETDYAFDRNGDTLYKEDSKMIEEAEAAGAVLLWNKTNSLPMTGTEKVSLLGRSSSDLVECGTGSGYVESYNYATGSKVTTTMKDAFESRGFTVNPTLWDFYSTGSGSKYKMISWSKSECKEWRQWSVNEVPQRVYTSDVKNSYSQYGDAAIITLSRSGGEYSDLHYNYSSSNDFVGSNDKNTMENTSAEGGYLGLSDEEEDLLKDISERKKNGEFKKVVLLINSGNPLQMQDFESYYDSIDACMWIGQPGSTGINAVVDLLKGKDLEGEALIPSGRLSDTWLYDNNSAPASENDGSYKYQNAELIDNQVKKGAFSDRYMVYQEGIYIGYRYYETRYYDSMLGQGHASSSKGAKHSSSEWKYDQEVAFPFGYGLSYTSFSYSGFSVKEQEDNYEVKVKVKNTGDYAGKDSVQVYLSKPYTDYDKNNQVEKSSVELCGYAKTDTLEPGKEEELAIEVKKEDFKTYDCNNEESYIIEEGDYYLTVASDSHVATNNILSYEGSGTEEEKVLGGIENTKDVSFGKTFVEKIHMKKDYKTYSVSSQTGEEVTNQLDSGDINKYANRGTNQVTYLSRNNWDSTYPSTPTLTLDEKMANDLLFDKTPEQDGYEIPEYSQFTSGETTPDVSKGDKVAIEFMDAPLYPEKEKDENLLKLVYDDGLAYKEHFTAMWDKLLNQMSFEEQCYMVVNSYHWIHGAVSIALPESRQENGPVGITKRNEAFFSLPNDETLKGETGSGWTWVAYPCAGILAASFDNDVAKRVGEHKSEDMLYLGYNGIYGPGVNMHRSPFGGRAFEYPSEDPYLSGYIEAHETQGIESKGCMAYVKHYALNDMETNRVNCGIWSNEQASREIYLRAFEIVFTEGKASATMNSFTRIGTVWNGASYAMMTSILRNEWGYDGLVISDWVTTDSAMSYVDGVMAGTDTFDGNGKADELTKYSDNAAVCQAVRLAAKRIIYNVVKTNVMNGMTLTSRTIAVTPWWETALVALDWVTGSIFAICAGMLTTSIIFKVKDKKNIKEEPQTTNA